MRRQAGDEGQSATTARTSLMIALWLSVFATPAAGQLSGQNLLGDFGLQAGSQPAPGIYLQLPFARYGSDTIKDRTGTALDIPGDLGLSYLFPTAYVVTDWTLFGANYGFVVAPLWANQRYESPRFDAETGFAVSDAYVVPLQLGWHTSRTDVTIGYGFIPPTGRYEAGADDNRGLGMWSHEISTGVTAYFDDAQQWHASTMLFYELHTDKKDSETRVGDLVTLEGGVGRSFLEGAGSVGLAYYAQWKATDDRFEQPLDLLLPGTNRVYGLGPEVTLPLFTSGAWVGLVTARYQWEFGAESWFEGQMFNVAATLAHIGWGD